MWFEKGKLYKNECYQVVALGYSNDHDQSGNDVVTSHGQAEHERGV